MKHKMMQLSVVAMLTMFIGSSALINAADSGGSTVVAKILIFEDGTYELTDAVTEKKGKRCKMKKRQMSDDGVERCRGFAEDEVLQNLTIPLIRTQGSICWTTYDSDGAATQVCWPS